MTRLRRPGNGRPIDWCVLRTMITGAPIVVRLKKARSSGKCHGIDCRVRSRRCARAIMIESLVILNGDWRFDCGMALVMIYDEIFYVVTENIVGFAREAQARQRIRRACQ